MLLRLVFLAVFAHCALAQNNDSAVPAAAADQGSSFTLVATPSAEGFAGYPMNISCSFTSADFQRNRYVMLVKLNGFGPGFNQLIFGINTMYRFQALLSVFMRSTIYLYRLAGSPDMRLIVSYNYMTVADTGMYVCFLGQNYASNVINVNVTMNETALNSTNPAYYQAASSTNGPQTTQCLRPNSPGVRDGIIPDFANYSSGQSNNFANGAYCNATNCVLECLDCGRVSPAVIAVVSVLGFLLILGGIAIFLVVRYKRKAALKAAASAALGKIKKMGEKDENPYATFENSAEPPSYDDVMTKKPEEAPYVTFNGV